MCGGDIDDGQRAGEVDVGVLVGHGWGGGMRVLGGGVFDGGAALAVGCCTVDFLQMLACAVGVAWQGKPYHDSGERRTATKGRGGGVRGGLRRGIRGGTGSSGWGV